MVFTASSSHGPGSLTQEAEGLTWRHLQVRVQTIGPLGVVAALRSIALVGEGAGDTTVSEFRDELFTFTRVPFSLLFLVPEAWWLCQTGGGRRVRRGEMPLVAWKPTRDCCHGRQRQRGCTDLGEGLARTLQSGPGRGYHGRLVGPQGVAKSENGWEFWCLVRS